MSDIILPKGFKEIWSPIGTSQNLALSCPAQEILYQGTRASGKTDVSLMRFRRFVGLGYSSFWRGVIIDVQYSALDDLIQRAKRWFSRFDDGSKFYASKTDYKYVFKTGEELLFRAVANEDDYESKLHGSEFSFISFNEISKHATPDVYDQVLTLNRTSFKPSDYPLEDGSLLPELPMCAFNTCNPSGAGAWWLKRRFIDAGKRGEIVKKEVKIFNPRTQQDEVMARTQCHIFGTYRENNKLAPEYIASLETIEDPVKYAAWVLGSWDADDGSGRFAHVWDSSVNVIEPFDIPSTWYIDRSYDHGESHPFACLWFATSDGSDVKLRNGKTRSTIRGDVFMINSWIGCIEGKLNKGLNLLAVDIAKGIIERELAWGIHDRVHAGNADTSVYNVANGNCVASDMEKPVTIGNKVYNGVRWLRSDKSAGTRVAGWNQICNYLANAKGKPYRENAGLFVFNTNKLFIEIFPSLPRDDKNPDDLLTTSNDHAADALRYKIYGIKTGAKTGKTRGLM